MKRFLFLLLPLFARSQSHQTCLFECFHYLNPKVSVKQYIQLMAPGQDVYNDGYKGTPQSIWKFAQINFCVSEDNWTGAISKGFYILADIPAEDERHAILITKVDRKWVYYYDPGDKKMLKMRMSEFVYGQPNYLIPIK